MARAIYSTLEKKNDPDDLKGLKNLMESVFASSLIDLVNKNTPNNYSRSNYENALLWFRKTNKDYLFSFESICSIFNLNSSASFLNFSNNSNLFSFYSGVSSSLTRVRFNPE